MIIYLAGASAGNNSSVWKKYSDNDTAMPNRIFLGLDASTPADQVGKINVLESFYYIKDWMIPYINKHWNFMLDSGAFTFASNAKKHGEINWEKYAEKYAEFVVENNIQYYLELDIDEIKGLKYVEKLRKILERKTGKQPLPVWHKSRGLEYYDGMCKDYSYVALGGMAATHKRKYRNEFKKYANAMVYRAKQHGAKVHALGFTEVKTLHNYRFHSVDSSAWLYGNKAGFIYHFNGRDLNKHYKDGYWLKYLEGGVHNFKEWVKFCKFAETW